MKKISKHIMYIIAAVVIIYLESCQASFSKETLTTEESMVMALKWQEANPIYAKAPTDWTNGAYYTGVARAHKSTKNAEYLAALKAMGLRNEWKPWERFYHADDLAICYAYLYLNSIGHDKVNLAPTDSVIQDHLFKPHEWRDGIEDRDQRNLWWWSDALFMTPPVITKYAKLKDDTAYLDEMHKYYLESYELLYDKEEKLFARDIRFVWNGDENDIKEPNGKKIFWSRGNGWVLAGLALLLEDMPKNYQHRGFYEELFKEMAYRIHEIQPKDGLWRTSLLSPETYEHGEVSGSGFFTFALAWGVNNGLLDSKKYLPTILSAWESLQQCQHPNGMVGWVQSIGAAPEPATKDSWHNFGTGAYLLAGSEVLKINTNKVN